MVYGSETRCVVGTLAIPASPHSSEVTVPDQIPFVAQSPAPTDALEQQVSLSKFERRTFSLMGLVSCTSFLDDGLPISPPRVASRPQLQNLIRKFGTFCFLSNEPCVSIYV